MVVVPRRPKRHALLLSLASAPPRLYERACGRHNFACKLRRWEVREPRLLAHALLASGEEKGGFERECLPEQREDHHRYPQQQSQQQAKQSIKKSEASYCGSSAYDTLHAYPM
ncbi:hypothetical protein TcG_01534 [Trypanosoma cruzi]|nr:hypothetical protein TcG_01534 [Trypanosoma cruzi]